MADSPGVIEFEGLTDEEIAEELRLRSLVNFVPHLSPKYMPPRHLAALLERFELAVDGIPQRVCCSAPPRHAKTESVLHVPAFGLRRRPGLRLSYSTYADRLSRSKSRKARQLAQASGVILESTSLNEWRTAEGGGLLAGGVGGPLTGHGVDILIVDDPIKNRVEAESAVFRARLLDWWHDVAATRIEPGGSAFIFMTRWHEDDLIGTLTREEGFEYINLPALTDDDTPLWPERWPLEAMRARRADVGEYTWASLYQGQPRPRGGRVFNDVHTYATPPIVYTSAIGIDLAAKEKTSSDFSAAVLMARVGRDFYVLDVEHEQEAPPAFKRRVHVMHRANQGAQIRWYAAGMEQAAASFWNEGDDAVPLQSPAPRGDKFTRAIKYAAAWNAGRIKVPKNAKWLTRFLVEHASFTGVKDKHDDIIDAAVAAFDLLDSPGSTTGPMHAPATETAPLRTSAM